MVTRWSYTHWSRSRSRFTHLGPDTDSHTRYNIVQVFTCISPLFSIQCSVLSIQYSVFSIRNSVFGIQLSVFSPCSGSCRSIIGAHVPMHNMVPARFVRGLHFAGASPNASVYLPTERQLILQQAAAQGMSCAACPR